VDLEPVRLADGRGQQAVQNQWMRWTAEEGVQLRLVKYADPEYYQAFLDENVRPKPSNRGDLSNRYQQQSLDRFRLIPYVMVIANWVSSLSYGYRQDSAF